VASANLAKNSSRNPSRSPSRPQTSNSKTYHLSTPEAKTVRIKEKKESITVSLQEQVRNELL